MKLKVANFSLTLRISNFNAIKALEIRQDYENCSILSAIPWYLFCFFKGLNGSDVEQVTFTGQVD